MHITNINDMINKTIDYLNKEISSMYTRNNIDKNIIEGLFKSNLDLFTYIVKGLSIRDLRLLLIDVITSKVNLRSFPEELSFTKILKYYGDYRMIYKSMDEDYYKHKEFGEDIYNYVIKYLNNSKYSDEFLYYSTKMCKHLNQFFENSISHPPEIYQIINKHLDMEDKITNN